MRTSDGRRRSRFFLKDRWWDEDRHWTIRPGVADWFAQLTTLSHSVHRLLFGLDDNIRARADSLQWNPALALESLGWG